MLIMITIKFAKQVYRLENVIFGAPDRGKALEPKQGGMVKVKWVTVKSFRHC